VATEEVVYPEGGSGGAEWISEGTLFGLFGVPHNSRLRATRLTSTITASGTGPIAGTVSGANTGAGTVGTAHATTKTSNINVNTDINANADANANANISNTPGPSIIQVGGPVDRHLPLSEYVIDLVSALLFSPLDQLAYTEWLKSAGPDGDDFEGNWGRKPTDRKRLRLRAMRDKPQGERIPTKDEAAVKLQAAWRSKYVDNSFKHVRFPCLDNPTQSFEKLKILL
jgi:hypothetical protein